MSEGININLDINSLVKKLTSINSIIRRDNIASREDIHHACKSLARLQQFYSINTNDFSIGIIKGDAKK